MNIWNHRKNCKKTGAFVTIQDIQLGTIKWKLVCCKDKRKRKWRGDGGGGGGLIRVRRLFETISVKGGDYSRDCYYSRKYGTCKFHNRKMLHLYKFRHSLTRSRVLGRRAIRFHFALLRNCFALISFNPNKIASTTGFVVSEMRADAP